MSAIFNLDRFAKLEKRNLFLSKIQYIYITGGLVGLYILSILMQILTERNLSSIIYLMAAVIVISAPCFLEKSINKYSSIFDFILPSSTFEKFFSFWLKYVIVIPGAICLVILILNLVTSILPFDIMKEHAATMSLTSNILNIKAIQSIYVLQSIFMLGYFYFRKYAFAKTSLIILLIFVLIMFIGSVLAYSVLTSKDMLTNITMSPRESYQLGYQLGLSGDFTNVYEDMIIKIADTITDILLPLGLWIVCFFKLRETEI